MSEKVERLVNSKQLAALVKEGKTVKDRTSSIAGEFGERVKAARENGHLNGVVFRWMAQLFRMPELERIRAINLFPVYCDKLIEEGVFGPMHVGDLVDNAEKQRADEDDNETDDDTGEADEFDEADPAREQVAANADAIEKGISELPAEEDRGALNGIAATSNDNDDGEDGNSQPAPKASRPKRKHVLDELTAPVSVQ